MDPSPPTLRIMAHGIYRTVLPAGLRPRLPIHRRPLSSGVYSLFGETQASSHELITTAALPYTSSSTLDSANLEGAKTTESSSITYIGVPQSEFRLRGLDDDTKRVDTKQLCHSSYVLSIFVISFPSPKHSKQSASITGP
jgi:hypothetical protein